MFQGTTDRVDPGAYSSGDEDEGAEDDEEDDQLNKPTKGVVLLHLMIFLLLFQSIKSTRNLLQSDPRLVHLHHRCYHLSHCDQRGGHQGPQHHEKVESTVVLPLMV